MSAISEGVGTQRLIRALASRWLDLRARVSQVTAGPRQMAKPVTDVVSPGAWLLLGCVALSGLGGLVLGWQELGIAGWIGACVLLVAVIFILGRHQLEAQLDLSRDRVVVGQRASGRLLLSNRGAGRTLPMTVELPVGHGRADFDLPSLGGHATHEDLFAIPTERRAVLTVGPVNAVRADPLSLLKREQDLTERELLFVHPRTIPVEGSAAGIINDLEGQTTKKLSSSDVSFHALRAYVPGDDRRHIHWKSTARTGTMMVRQFEETKRSHLLVTLSTRVEDYASEDEFELAVSIAGSLGAQCLKDGQTLSVATSTRQLAVHHTQKLLDQLAGVDFERSAPRLPEVARKLATDISGASVVTMVCGSLVHAAEVRSAARRFNVDIRTIVVRSEPGKDTSLRKFGEVDLATLGDLDDLPSVVRRLAK